MPHRRVVMFMLVAVAIAVAAFVTNFVLDERRQHSAALAALPEAQAFLADPRYQGVKVEVSQFGWDGYGLWFTGSLPTQAECNELEQSLRKRFASPEFVFMYTVLSSSGIHTAPGAPTAPG